MNITASVRKTSGVQISRGEFALYIPAFSSETGSNFFFYPVQLINVRIRERIEEEVDEKER